MFAFLCSLIRRLILPGQAREIALENLALRQQLTVFKRRCPRPRLRKTDRLFWVCLAKIWKDWRRALIIVKPETVVSWHRKGFRLFWTWISMRKRSGRPEANPEIRALIRKMASAQPALGCTSHPRGVGYRGRSSRFEKEIDAVGAGVETRFVPKHRHRA